MSAQTYNGWANYETWNVALYINNEYAMYQTAVEWVNETLGLGYEKLIMIVSVTHLQNCLVHKPLTEFVGMMTLWITQN